ncbi:MAG: hypothetical protein KF767_08925 [Bdellovibrionaceae bacterium]|nr:hypothetical protein [Pseudobdellovibrionaceae bacterium]
MSQRTLIVYIAMLIFDLSLLAGTAYLVTYEGYSAWWFLFTVLFTSACGPNLFRDGAK